MLLALFVAKFQELVEKMGVAGVDHFHLLAEREGDYDPRDL